MVGCFDGVLFCFPSCSDDEVNQMRDMRNDYDCVNVDESNDVYGSVIKMDDASDHEYVLHNDGALIRITDFKDSFAILLDESTAIALRDVLDELISRTY